MAFSDEDKEELRNMFSEFFKAQTPPEDPKDKEPKGDNIVNEAKEAYRKEVEAKELNASLANAIKFNMSVDGFIKDNEAILPKEARALFDTVNNKVYSTDVEKANVLRKGLIEQFIELKENFDILPSSLKDKANRFKALTDDEKVKQSGKFWDIVEIGASQKVLIRKAEQFNKQGGQEQKTEFSEFEKRVLNKARNIKEN